MIYFTCTCNQICAHVKKYLLLWEKSLLKIIHCKKRAHKWLWYWTTYIMWPTSWIGSASFSRLSAIWRLFMMDSRAASISFPRLKSSVPTVVSGSHKHTDLKKKVFFLYVYLTFMNLKGQKLKRWLWSFWASKINNEK